MIKSFTDKDTRKIWERQYVKRLPDDIRKRARNKLIMLHRSADINDLRTPPGNRLEKLSGDREGQWSIRINRQWRVCFVWQGGDAYRVEITDYH